MGDTVKDMTAKFGKLDKFEGNDFRRWQKKMHFLLTKYRYCLGRKAHLLEDKQIPSVGVFDEVFSTWMTFGGNTYRGDGIASLKRHSCDLSSDGIEDLTTASRCNRLKSYLEDSTWLKQKRLLGNEEVWVEMHRGIAWDKVENLNPQSTPQVLPSFEENTPPVTYSNEVEEIIGILIEVEPLDETPQLEDLGLNTYNHDIPLSSREVPSFDEPEPQPQPLPNCPSLDVSLGDETGPEPPIKPHSLDSFRMKVVDNLTIHTPPSPHVASLHPKDTYCYYHPCIDDPKKHYGFKPGLLGQSGSLGVDFLNMEMIENDWELESKEVSFLGRGLNSPVRPKEVEKENEKKIFTVTGDGVRIYPDGVVIFDEKKLGSS
ncbi:hypothetical protein Tco_0824262 [Tanacetum coccineum]|uniref:Zinc finger, CCHC-type n=1 Tax=Tanacetum coccineum TaxID=301880 RepID=A0ABQ5APL7_9ASTR